LDTYFRFVLALLFVIGLIALIAWLARRYGLGGVAIPNTGRRKRLRLVEAMTLDAKRRLVLVRRDGVEHLILLGSQGDVAIETGIPAGEDGVAGRETSFAAALAAGAEDQTGTHT
jgi:flagellar protein FliO/FliZ